MVSKERIRRYTCDAGFNRVLVLSIFFSFRFAALLVMFACSGTEKPVDKEAPVALPLSIVVERNVDIPLVLHV